MKTIITPLFIILFTIGYGFEIKFGEAEKVNKRNKIQLIGETGNAVFVYRFKPMPLGVEKHTLSKYDPNTLQTIQEIDLDMKRKNYEGFRIFNGNILLFQNEKESKSSTRRMFYDVYDANSLNIKEQNKQVAEFEYKKGLFSKLGSFQIFLSEDETKFAAYYDLPYKKGEPEKFGFAVYDSNCDLMYQVEANLPVSDENMTLGAPYISNQGRFFISAEEVTDKTFFGRPSEVSHHIYEIAEDGSFKDYNLDLGDKFIFEYTYSANQDGNLICTGLYGDKEKRTGVSGGFYLRLDSDSRTVAEANYKDFPMEFITSGWSDRQKKKAKKRKNKGKGDPTLYNYDIRQIVTMDDGSAVMTAEQFYIRVVTYRDANGNTRTTYYYYYNDIIVMKLNKEGKFDWYAKIPKYQVSTNDGGYYSSYAFHVSQGKLYFMFNDNIKNYQDGNVVGGKTYSTSFRSNKKNVTSLVTMDISNGDNKKQQLFGKSDFGTIAVPKVNVSDLDLDKLYIFSKKGRKERLGVINF